MVMYAGQGVDLIKEILPAGEVKPVRQSNIEHKRITRYIRTYLVRNFGLTSVNATGEASLVSVDSSMTMRT
uniref:Uncharacterized protein n=1 Tax=Nelumbo nucifera TaxID=4432 RepID=A0A822YK73_NELNU|nr:TPA_asm: hypothetical protein HUJ06_031226 [Nelumbo nucifera]